MKLQKLTFNFMNKKKVLGLEEQRGIIVGDDGFSVDVYWYKDAKRVISELKEFLEVVSESR